MFQSGALARPRCEPLAELPGVTLGTPGLNRLGGADDRGGELPICARSNHRGFDIASLRANSVAENSMPYSTGMIVFLAGIAVVFATFAYLMVNARSLMRLFRPMSDGDIDLGPGRKGPSNAVILFALVLHFAGWALAGFAWLYLLADVRATAPDNTPQEQAGIVDGEGQD